MVRHVEENQTPIMRDDVFGYGGPVDDAKADEYEERLAVGVALLGIIVMLSVFFGFAIYFWLRG